MPQLTYIDTEAPPKKRRPSPWRRVLRLLVRQRFVLLGLMACYRFAGLSFGEMQQWDESIYALRAQVILRFGDVWDQSAHMLSGLYYSVHPPLYVWLATSMTMLFGDALWVYRLPSALAAALLVPLLYRYARRTLPAGRSLAVAGLFAFAPLPAFYSRQGQLDLLLALCMLAALSFAYGSIRSGRRSDAVVAGLCLGAALMTKFAFALSVPAAVAATALLLPPPLRRRALRAAVIMTAASLPVWLPWAVSMSVTHGDGDPLWLFSPSLPLGATFAGAEGTAKETGSLYYLNQLVVQLSFLLPFVLVFLWHALSAWRRTAWTLAAVFLAVQLLALWVMGTSFAVYLIPALPLLVYAGVHGMARVRAMQPGGMFAATAASVLCFTWSLSPAWRVAVKDILRALRGVRVPEEAWSAAVFLAALTAFLLLGAWLLHRRRLLRDWLTLPLLIAAVIALAVSTMTRIWVRDPGAHIDGAAAAARAVRHSTADRVLLVGNGDNPQLTWYLEGADIGWSRGEERRFTRLEPHALGVEGIREHVRRHADTLRVAMIVERDEIAQGVYRTPQDVLPRGFVITVETPRYFVAAEAEVRLDTLTRDAE